MNVYIWTDKPFYPTVNTIAYYPLTASSTVNDISGNNLNLTNTNVTFGSYKGVDCGYFSGSAKLTATYVNSGIACTILTWEYYINPGTGKDADLVRWGSNFGPYVNLDGGNGTLKCSPGAIGSVVQTSDSNWKLIAVTYNGSNTLKMYENGTLVGTNSSASVPTGTAFVIGANTNTNYPAYWKGGISNVIVENVVWEQAKIQEYYNRTKGAYGL